MKGVYAEWTCVSSFSMTILIWSPALLRHFSDDVYDNYNSTRELIESFYWKSIHFKSEVCSAQSDRRQKLSPPPGNPLKLRQIWENSGQTAHLQSLTWVFLSVFLKTSDVENCIFLEKRGLLPGCASVWSDHSPRYSPIPLCRFLPYLRWFMSFEFSPWIFQ